MHNTIDETYRLEDLGRVVVDRVLARPLLEDEDDDGDDEPDEVAFAEERLAETEPCARGTFLLNGSLNLGHLGHNRLVVWPQFAEVREVPCRLFDTVLGREPTR